MDSATLHRFTNMLQVVIGEHTLALRACTMSAKDHHIGRGERATQEIVLIAKQLNAAEYESANVKT